MCAGSRGAAARRRLGRGRWSCGLLLCESPFRPAVLEAAGPDSRAVKPADGLVRVRAKWTAAIGHDLAVYGQLGEPLLELVERDRARAVDVPGGVFLRGADVEHEDVTAGQALAQLVAVDRLDVGAEVGARGALDFGQLGKRRVAQCEPRSQRV